MTSQRGILIAIEGIDGAGKHTQTRALRKEFERIGHKVCELTFPDYGSSHLGITLKAMLSGTFGDASKIHPTLSAPLFALERAQKRDAILRDLYAHCVVLCDRYVYSNVAHQASRLPALEREQFQRWVEEIEFGILKMPRADVTVLLDVDDEVANTRRRVRSEDPMNNRELDDYERDETALSLTRSIYLELAEKLGWIVVNTTFDGRSFDRDSITREMLDQIRSLPLELT